MDLKPLVAQAVARLRTAGTDLRDIEVKAAEGGLPKSTVETVSAFANASGGLIVLGVAEGAGFAPVPIDAAKVAADLASACADQLEPPIRADIDIAELEGHPVVAAWIDPLPSDRRPCFVRSRGMDRGSYLRTHDGDRAMTSYEVHVMVASKGQPTDDATPVTDARREHLDDDLVARLCQRLRDTRGAVFASSSEEQILRMMRVIVDTDSGVAPTTAGLLALGRYPQQFFPQLDITFVAYPTDNGDPLPDGTRFLDNQSVDGPIPTMVATTVAIVRRNLRRRAVIGGAGREDRWDYPEEAVRELVANALMHRDLHPSAHGTQVRVALYPDRLEVASPGGLHGPISQQDLFAEPISSSRNAILAKLLEDVEIPGTGRTVCENRGSGLLATAAALRRAGIEPPRVHDSVREFRVTVKNEGLLDSQTIRWLTSIGAATLNDRQRLGLAFARRNGSVTNQQYRTVTGCDPSVATRELAGLAGLGLLAKRSDKRWTVWDLADGSQRPTAQAQLDFTPTTDRSTRGNRIEEIIGLLRSGPKSTIELSAALGMTREGVLQWLRRMEGRGLVRPTEANRKSSKNRWKLTDAPR